MILWVRNKKIGTKIKLVNKIICHRKTIKNTKNGINITMRFMEKTNLSMKILICRNFQLV